jgi:hypothetical protein
MGKSMVAMKVSGYREGKIITVKDIGKIKQK